MPLKIRDITNTILPFGQTPDYAYTEVFKNIGNYFSENAERLASAVEQKHAGMKIEIDVPVSDIVTVTIKNTEYITNRKQEEMENE